MVEFGNLLNYTAMGLGNHDFDDQIDGFVPFAEQTSFPLLASNIVLHNDSLGFTSGVHFNSSVVVSVKGVQVGIVGYVTTSTVYNFPDREVEFTEEIKAVGAEARRLKEKGVEVIIALGHSGYDIDIKLAESIPELDIVVGGHSHTFLYTKQDPSDPYPSIETPSGDYPTYVENLNSSKVIPVVQAYCYTKYLGHLNLNFGPGGDLLEPVDGTGVSMAEPRLLDSSYHQSSEVEKIMDKYRKNLTEFMTTIGVNEILLIEGDNSEEWNIGDVLTESMAAVYNDTRISFSNNGGIRSAIDVGDVWYDDIMYVMPFDNTVDLVTMNGKGIRASIEAAAAGINPEDVNEYPGFGYQLCGLKVEIEAAKDNVNSRVVSLLVQEEDGNFVPIEEEKVYNVALPSFLAGGGTKKSRQIRGLFDEGILSHEVGTIMTYEALRNYVNATSPLARKVDGRLTVTGSSTTTEPPSTATEPSSSTSIQNCLTIFFFAISLNHFC